MTFGLELQIMAIRVVIMATRIALGLFGIDFGWCDSCGEPAILYDAVCMACTD